MGGFCPKRFFLIVFLFAKLIFNKFPDFSVIKIFSSVINDRLHGLLKFLITICIIFFKIEFTVLTIIVNIVVAINAAPSAIFWIIFGSVDVNRFGANEPVIKYHEEY